MTRSTANDLQLRFRIPMENVIVIKNATGSNFQARERTLARGKTNAR